MMLSTKRLFLRPIAPQDMNDYYDFYQLESVCAFLPNEPWRADTKQKEFEVKVNNNHLDNHSNLLLSVIYQEKVIGVIYIMPNEMPETYEIGYVFHPNFSKQGLAFEAVSATIDYLFYTLNAHRIFANLDTRNLASKNLCEKLSMRQEAHCIEDYLCKGVWTDSFIYAILKREWLKTEDD